MTTTLLAVLIGVAAAALLLAAGYLFGVRRGSSAREALRQRLSTRGLDGDDESLRGAIQQLLAPLVERDQLGYDLAHLELGTGRRGELPRLLDDIADKGGFATVLLSDQDGLPLAASSGAADVDRLAGYSSMVMVVADRLSRNAGPAPLAITVHDESNQQLLSRLFAVAGQSLVLTAVAAGTNLSPTALDPALAKLEAILAPVETG